MIDWSMLQQYAGYLVRGSIADGATGAHITRYTMYRRIRELASHWSLPGAMKVLSISHSEALCRMLGLNTPIITALNYPEGDLLALPYDTNTFDCVVSDQVLEHVAGDPFQAVRESFRVVRHGGLVVHTSCFINEIHGAPGDYWRFTPNALRLLCEQDGLVEDAGAWGNPYAWIAIALGLRYQPVPEDVAHPLHKLATYDDPLWPIVTWVAARKKPRADNSLITRGRLALCDAEAPTRVDAAARFLVRLNLINASSTALSSHYKNPVLLSYHWFTREGECVIFDGERTRLPFDLERGEKANVNVRVVSPNRPGSYRLQLSLVQERVNWLHDVIPGAALWLDVEVA